MLLLQLSRDQPGTQHPDDNKRYGVKPFFGFVILPHSLCFLAITLEGVLRDEMNRQGDQCGENDKVVKVTENRDEIGDEVDGREGVNQGEGCHSFGIPGSLGAFQAQEDGRYIGP